MPKAKTVKDIMVSISKYPHIPHWFSAVKAIKTVRVLLLDIKKHTELPIVLVLDEKYNLRGLLTLRGLLKGLKGSKEPDKVQVSDLMTPVSSYVTPEDTVEKAAALMLENDLDLMPVVDDGNRFIGLVRMIDIFEELSNTF